MPHRLEGPSDTLSRAEPATRRPFLLLSRTGVVEGGEMEGITRAEVAGHPLLRGLTTGGGACAAVHQGPHTLRRELLGPGGSVLETILLPPDEAGLVVQWSPGREGELALSGSFLCPGGVQSHRTDGSDLVVERAGAPRALFRVTPTPEEWAAEDDPAGPGVRISFTTRAADGLVTLLATAEDDGSPGATPGPGPLVRLGRLRVHETRAADEVGRARRRRLTTETGVAELDDALAWAVVRMPGALTPDGDLRRGVGTGCPSPGAELAPMRLWTMVGALAAGDHETAARLAERPPTTAADVAGLGWWVRWTGDPTPLLAHEAVAHELTEVRPRGPVERVLRRAALEGLADGLEAAERSGRASAPHRRKEAGGPSSTDVPRQAVGGTTGTRRLPVVGANPAERSPDELHAGLIHRILLDEPGPLPALPPPGDSVRCALAAWAGFAGPDPERAYLELRTHLAAGLADVIGAWPLEEGHPCFHWPPAAALVPATVLYGLLGARAEAPWGRLTLAPVLPPSWREFRVRGVTVGDARVEVRYQRDHGTVRFRVEQASGRVPLDLVFQPALPMDAGAVRRVVVDGETADVEVGAALAPGRAALSLQLPLDAPRSVVIETYSSSM